MFVKRFLALLLFALGPISLHAQPVPLIKTSNGPPTSGCGANWLDVDYTTGNLYSCLHSVWVPVSAGAGGGVTSVSGDVHINVTNPTTTPALTFLPQPNDYAFSDISGTVGTGQLPSSVATFTHGAGDPVSSCTAPGNLYEDDNSPNDLWYCSATNVWRKVLSTSNTGVWSITGLNGADPCGTVSAGFDCLSLNSTDQLTLKNAAGLITVVGPNPPIGPTPGAPANQILNGCGVEYTSGLSFTVGACTYAIGGTTYSSPLTTLTLSTADPTNPRLDTIIVDITSTASVLTGTPAATPVAPTIDPSTQLALTIGLQVAANATTPSNVTTDNIYDENTEWTCTASAHFNCASTNNPYHGTKDIEFTAAVLNNNVTLVKPAAGTVDLAARNMLIFYLRSKAAWPTGASGSTAARSLAVWWQNGATQKGLQVIVKDGTFGFSSSSTAAYQQIAIPTSLFGANGLPVTTLKFNISGPTGTSSIGGYIDEVSLQAGVAPPILPTTLMNFQGTWSSTTAYNPNDTVVSGGIGYIALLANTNVAVTTASTWAPVASAGTVGLGTATHLAYYASTGTTIADMGADYTFVTHTLTGGASSILDTTAGSAKVATQTAGNNTTSAASTAFVTTAINNAIAGVNPAVAVLAASTGNVVGTYTPVGSGIGDTFTVTATGAFTLDGIAINTIGQRVLLKDQSTAFQNGIYTATVIGVSLVSPVFTRALDFDQASDINNTGAIPVISGTVNTTTQWVVTSTVTNVGSDSITFAKFSLNPSTIVTSASTIGANLPVFGSDGSRGVAAGTRSGNTTEVMSATGSFISGNLLKTDANGNAVDTGIPASGVGSLGLTLLEEHTASNSASLNFATCISTANQSLYDNFTIKLVALVPAHNLDDFAMRFSTDSGSTYHAGSSDYVFAVPRFAQASSANNGSQGATSLVFSSVNQVTNTASLGGETGTFDLSIVPSARAMLIGSVAFQIDDLDTLLINFAGTYRSTTTINAFQVIAASGNNITSGTVRCYGLSK